MVDLSILQLDKQPRRHTASYTYLKYSCEFLSVHLYTFKPSTTKLTSFQLRKWARDRLPKYGIPSLLKVMDTLPHSAGGTVNKKELGEQAFPITTIH